MGSPFIGKAGQFLRQNLKELGLELNRDAWSTNAIICRPPHNKIPDDNQIAYCRPNLLNTIRLYNPKVVVTLGRSALVSALTGIWGDIGPLERWVGWKIPLDKYWVCPTYHPNFLLKMENSLMDRLFSQHLAEAFEKAEEVLPKMPNLAKHIEIIYDDVQAYEALREIDSEGGWVAIDYETNCLKPELPLAQVYSCAVSNGRRTISYPWAGSAIGGTGRLFKSPRTRKIASNLKFEERWTRKTFGHGVRNWGWDTMLAAHCLDNRQGICSIKFQALVKMGVPSYNDHIDPYLKSNGTTPYNRVGEIAVKDLLFYGGMDAILEYQVAMIQRQEMGYRGD
jgi:uracil-DNA glycosylase family 4